MHGAGINHRDFYLCHFHLDLATVDDEQPRCHVIDLHRAQQRDVIPRRWQVKDLAGLYFSAMDCGLRRRDLLRFLSRYTPGGLREALAGIVHFFRGMGDMFAKVVTLIVAADRAQHLAQVVRPALAAGRHAHLLPARSHLELAPPPERRTGEPHAGGLGAGRDQCDRQLSLASGQPEPGQPNNRTQLESPGRLF